MVVSFMCHFGFSSLFFECIVSCVSVICIRIFMCDLD